MNDILTILQTIREIQHDAESPEALAKLVKLEREIEVAISEYHTRRPSAHC